MKKWNRILAALLISVLGLSLVGCQKKVETGENKEETEKTASSTTSSLTGIPLTSSDLTVVIGEQGYRALPIILNQGWFDEVFAENNITIEVKKFNNGPEMLEAFTAEQLDVSLMGMQPGISGVANNAGISIAASFCDAPTGIGIYVLKDSGIGSMADLKGKKVGTTIGSNAYSLLLKTLADENLSVEKDVEFVNIDFTASTAALESGEIDAVAGYADIFDQAAKNDGDIFKQIKDASGYGISENVITVRNDFAKEHADVVENILALFQKANEFINDNYDEAVKINADYYELDEEVVRASLNRYTYDWLDQEKLKDDIEDYIQFMYENELIQKQLDVNEVVDFSYFDETFGK